MRRRLWGLRKMILRIGLFEYRHHLTSTLHHPTHYCHCLRQRTVADTTFVLWKTNWRPTSSYCWCGSFQDSCCIFSPPGFPSPYFLKFLKFLVHWLPGCKVTQRTNKTSFVVPDTTLAIRAMFSLCLMPSCRLMEALRHLFGKGWRHRDTVTNPIAFALVGPSPTS